MASMITEGYKGLRAEAALTSGDGDEWGWTLGWLYAVAHVLNCATVRPVPSSWRYLHGAFKCDIPDLWEPDEIWAATGLDYQESIILSLFRTERVTSLDILNWGIVLDRYACWLQLAGQDY